MSTAVDPELAAIRARDDQWICDGRVGTPEHDRRVLLQLVDDLMAGIEAIAVDIKLIQKTHRERYATKATPPENPGNIDP